MINRVKKRYCRSICFSAIAVLLCGTALAADGIPSDYLSGQSEQQIGDAAASAALQTVRATYEFLPRHFSDADIRTAGGFAEVELLRTKYHLAEHFDSTQLAHAMGLEKIAWLHRELPVGATIHDLAVSEAKSLIRMVSRSHKGLREDFSYGEYIRVIGEEIVASWRLDLPGDFGYADLVQKLGPSGAAQMRRLYGFSKGATGDEIVRACGAWRAASFVNKEGARTFDFINLKLDVDATADQILQVFVASELRQLQNRFGPDSERALAEALGQESLRYYAKSFKLPGAFTEVEVQAAAGESAVQLLRDRFDLDEHFTDLDIAAAAAASGQAVERFNFHLPPGFTAAQDADARKLSSKR